MGLPLDRKQRRPQPALGQRSLEERRQTICGPSAHLDERIASRPRSTAAYAAAATLPLKVRPNFVAEIATLSPSLTRPERINSASGSCRYFWITRLSGRAP